MSKIRKQTRQIRTTTILRRIRQSSPVTPAQWRALGVKFDVIGHGVFREVCRIKGTDLVVKSPLAEGNLDYSEGIAHARSEMNRLSRLERIDVLKPYLPRVFWYDSKHGQIVMRYYEPLQKEDRVQSLGRLVKDLVRHHYGILLGDIHEDNLRKKRKNTINPVFVDLGY